MKEIHKAVELTDSEKLLLFYLLNPTLNFHFGAFKMEARVIIAVLGEERLEGICVDLNNTIFDTDAIIRLSERNL